MLMDISKLITPEVYDVIYRMGHFDELVIADANYSATTMSSRVVHSSVEKNEDLLRSILKYFPIDEDEEKAVFVMIPDHGFDHVPESWKGYQKVLEDFDYIEDAKLTKISRVEFYEKTKRAYATIQTNDIRLYADIIIRKGFVVE
jgi:L-fucose mutarotase